MLRLAAPTSPSRSPYSATSAAARASSSRSPRSQSEEIIITYEAKLARGSKFRIIPQGHLRAWRGGGGRRGARPHAHRPGPSMCFEMSEMPQIFPLNYNIFRRSWAAAASPSTPGTFTSGASLPARAPCSGPGRTTGSRWSLSSPRSTTGRTSGRSSTSWYEEDIFYCAETIVEFWGNVACTLQREEVVTLLFVGAQCSLVPQSTCCTKA